MSNGGPPGYESEIEQIMRHASHLMSGGFRTTSNELSSLAGGIIGGAAGAFVAPIASAAGHAVAQVFGLEESD
jgi:hypothetical protein